jgi:hypothetical protein
MSIFETDFLANQPFLPELWLRYIDDIFMIWNHPEEELCQFITDLNNFNPNLKFTEEHSLQEVNYLDVTIYKKDNQLHSKLYCKPTDAHLYLLYDSCHPRSNKESIPYSQFIRMKRIHSEEIEYQKSADALENQLLRRKYPQKLINLSRKKAEEDTPQPRTNNTGIAQNKLIFVTRHNPRQVSIKPILTKYMAILQQDPNTKFLTQMNWIMAYRRPKSLKDILIKSDLASQNKKIKQLDGSYPCRRFRCKCCPHMKSTKSFTSKITGTNYTIKGNYNCQSKNIIYLIECRNCGIQYIGQTSTTMNTRFTAHRYDVKHHTDKSIPNHFNTPECSIQCIQVTVISQGSHDVALRHLQETSWIRRLFTHDPHGLNAIE